MSKKEKEGLTERQQSFVDHITSGKLLGAEAARRSGYASASARIAASRLKNNEKIKQAIADRRHEMSRKHGFDGDLMAVDLLAVINNPKSDTIQMIKAIRELGHLLGLYPN
jgi:phage terminase small subunit